MKSCGTCRFWDKDGDGPARDCKESSPQVIVSSFRHVYENESQTASTGKFMTVWPRTLKDGFCGKWEPL